MHYVVAHSGNRLAPRFTIAHALGSVREIGSYGGLVAMVGELGEQRIQRRLDRG